MNKLIIFRSNDVVSINILECVLFFDRLKGLIFMPPLCDESHQGMLFSNCNSIHMFFMRYPIDILYLNKDKRLLRIHRNVKPWRVSFCFNAFYVIEVSANSSWTKDFIVGDQFSW